MGLFKPDPDKINPVTGRPYRYDAELYAPGTARWPGWEAEHEQFRRRSNKPSRQERHPGPACRDNPEASDDTSHHNSAAHRAFWSGIPTARTALVYPCG